MNDKSDHTPKTPKNYAKALRAFLPEDAAYLPDFPTEYLGEVKDMADKAMALKERARDANERQIAAELQIAAERLLGEMLVKLRRHDELLASMLRPRNSEPNPIDDRAIDDLLALLADVPSTLDRAALRDAFEKAWTNQLQIDKFRPAPRARACSEQLTCIHEAADTLLSLLKAKNDATELIMQVAPEATLNVLRLVASIYGAKHVFDKSIKDTTAKYRPRIPQSIKGKTAKYLHRIPTAFEWLAGVELPCIYEEFFDPSESGPRGSRSKRGSSFGPKGLFIKESLSKFGMPCKDDSIRKAWTSLAELRVRRRAVRRRLIGQD